MNSELRNLYTIPENILPRNEYLLFLAEECQKAEFRVMQILTQLSQEHRCVLETYIQLRDQFELQAVRQAMRFGKKQGTDKIE